MADPPRRVEGEEAKDETERLTSGTRVADPHSNTETRDDEPTLTPRPATSLVAQSAVALGPLIEREEGSVTTVPTAQVMLNVEGPAAPSIGRRRTRRTRVDARASAKAVQRALRHATIYVHTVAAMAMAAKQLSERELLELRALLKRGRHRRRHDAATANHLERDLRARASMLAQRLPETALVLRDAQERADAQLRDDDGRRTRENERRKARAHTRSARNAMRAEGKVVLSVLTDEQAATVEKRQRVLHAMELGVSWQQACINEGVVASRATVWRWRKASRALGPEGLVDRRLLNGRAGLAPEIRAMALAAWQQCRGGQSGSVYAVLKRKCEATERDVPSQAWVADFIRYEIPADLKLVRDHGLSEWRRQAAPRHTVERARFGNELWQCDDVPLDIWVRGPLRDGQWEPLQPYATAIIDVHSRACMAIGVWTRTPNAWSVALTLRKAILPKASEHAPFRGVPVRFAMDNGKNYRSEALSQTLALADIRREYCAPQNPDEKPEVERFLGTAQRSLLPQLPGYKKAHMVSEGAAAKAVMSLLTIEQLRGEIDRWADIYNASHHTGISKAFDYTPRQLWEESVHLREIDPAVLNRLLLHSKARVVQQKGVQLTLRTGDTVHYWAPVLSERYQERVVIAYNPEDLVSVLVKDAATGLPICEAYRMDGECGRYTGDDIRRAQESRAAQLAGVAERLGAHHEEAERTDRLSPARAREAQDVLARIRAAEDAPLFAPVVRSRVLPASSTMDDPTRDEAREDGSMLVTAPPNAEGMPSAPRARGRTPRAAPRATTAPCSPLDHRIDGARADAERALLRRLSRITGGRL